MTAYGNRQTAGGKPTFGKKAAAPMAGRSGAAPKERLSPEAAAFLNAERARTSSAPARSATPSYANPKPAASSVHGAGKPVWGRRIIALLIDSALFVVPLVLLIVAMGPQPMMTDAQFATGFIAALLFVGLGSIVYYVVMESSSLQATLGKMAVGAIVVDKNGGKPTLGAIILRNTVGRFCSNMIPFYIGYFLGLFRADRRCLHDLIAGTMVCKRSADGAPANYSQVFA